MNRDYLGEDCIFSDCEGKFVEVEPVELDFIACNECEFEMDRHASKSRIIAYLIDEGYTVDVDQ